jgi:hypothetical protein
MQEPEPDKDSLGQRVLAAGDSEWYRAVAIPFAGEFEELIPQYLGDFPAALRQRMNRGATNHLLGYAVIGITVFVTKKIGDDFYDAFIKPRIRKCFEWLDEKLAGGNRKAKKIFVFNIWYKSHDVVISVAIVGKNFAEIVSQLNLLGVVHTSALNWIAKRGVCAPVHYYRIENGQVNAAPLLLERIDQIEGLQL